MHVKPKIAILYSGFLRNYKVNLSRIKDLFLDNDSLSCDLYIFTSYDEYQKDKYINSKTNRDTLLNDLKPKICILEQSSSSSSIHTRIKEMWFKLSCLSEHLQMIEIKDNFTYDFILRIRPDLFINLTKNDITSFMNQSNLGIIVPMHPNTSYAQHNLDNHSGLCDQFAFGNRKDMLIYLSTYNRLAEYNSYGFINSSSILKKYLKDKNIVVHEKDIETKLLLKENTLITIAGDSGSGKTTFGEMLKASFEDNNNVLLFDCDRYHKWERKDSMWQTITHLNPNANNIEAMKDDIMFLKADKSINQVEYDHKSGKFTDAFLVSPASIIVVSGLHTLFDETLNMMSDVKIYMEPLVELKTEWKIKRDVVTRGHKIYDVLKSIEERKDDYDTYIKPQRNNADYLICQDISNVKCINCKTKNVDTFETMQDCVNFVHNIIVKI